MLVGAGTKCAICGKLVFDHTRGVFLSARLVHVACLERYPLVDVSSLPVWPVTRVGYFREFTKRPANPWLSDCIMANEAEDEVRLIAYLEQGITLVPSSRRVVDPLGKEYEVIGTESVMTDGVWDWPNYLPKLLAKYHVRLSLLFLEHVKNSNWSIPLASDA